VPRATPKFHIEVHVGVLVHLYIESTEYFVPDVVATPANMG